MSSNKVEKKLIEYIKSRSESSEGLPGLGIGDDAAFLLLSSMDEGKLIISTDSVIEGVHFKSSWGSYADAAVKLFERVSSDILAKGGHPHWMLLNLNITAEFASDEKTWTQFIDSLCNKLREHHIALIGGDISLSPVNSFTSTVFGNASFFVRRQNPDIKEGDLLVLWGKVGGSTFALEKLVSGEIVEKEILGYYTKPAACWENGWLKTLGAKAAMDQSDSLWETFEQLAGDNHIGLKINLEKIPLHVQLAGQSNNISPLSFAEMVLKSAEDLALVAILPKEKIEDAKKTSGLSIIGEVESALNPDMNFFIHNEKINFANSPGFYTHFREMGSSDPI
jgi:thiamine-monophosphate kinase